jgi:DNA-binding transcriptional MerR regulator
MHVGEPKLSIGQVSERTGLSVHALRFYEREGILAYPVQRGPGGHRVYSQDDVEWLELCLILRASAMPLPEIRKYSDLVRAGAGNEEERLELLRGHREQVAAQMADLAKCLDLINDKIAGYEDILAEGAADHEGKPV